ncbi:MAG TPA: hypothetical protein V6D08_18735 [Candidatus Obscuribacterales bacterium]
MVARPKPYMRKLRATTLIAARLGVENIFPTIGAAVRSIAAREQRARHGRPLKKTESFRSFYERLELSRQGQPAEQPES